MKERPILFSAPMVRAILDGTKTQTRRVLKLRGGQEIEHSSLFSARDPFAMVTSPYGTRGDRLWVRETFAPRYFDDGKPGYRADWDGRAADCVPEPRWKPSIFMRRHESRITLEVTGVRVQRLQAISAEDSLAEGVPRASECGCEVCRRSTQMCPADASEQVMAYAGLWDSINGKRARCAWQDNPWVWAVTFRRLP